VPSFLVVDDEQSICWGLARLGESLGHAVSVAASAEQALREARQRRPDVIILDVRLPGMDGLTAIERFQDQCGTVPIIVITAYGDLQTAVDAVRRGAFDYIAKPYAIEHALIMSRGRAMLPEHLPPEVAFTSPATIGADADRAVVAAIRHWAEQNIDRSEDHAQLYERWIGVIEPPLFEVALARHKGQFATAARALGIHRTTLRKKLPDHDSGNE
jgi:DNA-binding NtrC family response regulator